MKIRKELGQFLESPDIGSPEPSGFLRAFDREHLEGVPQWGPGIGSGASPIDYTPR
jgi:hypothetical protein